GGAVTRGLEQARGNRGGGFAVANGLGLDADALAALGPAVELFELRLEPGLLLASVGEADGDGAGILRRRRLRGLSSRFVFAALARRERAHHQDPDATHRGEDTTIGSRPLPAPS